jgi:hypothetical protein
MQTQNQDEQQLIAQRQAQWQRDSAPPTPEQEEAERARVAAEPTSTTGRLSVGLQPQPTPTVGVSAQVFADITWLPKFSVDDARKLNGGEGQQFRVDAVRMVEAETARVAQLHAVVGTSDIWLGREGLMTEPANDFTALDAALAAAQAEVDVRDTGDSDVKEIALISAALMETARYTAIAGAEQIVPPPPPPEGGVLRADPPIGQTAEPQWKQG